MRGTTAVEGAWLPDGYSQISRSYEFGPSGFWTLAPLRYAAKFDPFLSLDSTPHPPPWHNARKGRDQILPSGNPVTTTSTRFVPKAHAEMKMQLQGMSMTVAQLEFKNPRITQPVSQPLNPQSKKCQQTPCSFQRNSVLGRAAEIEI